MLKRKFSLIIVGMTLILISIVLVGCKKDDKPEDKIIAIKTVLQDTENNEEVFVQGTVYGVVDNGFYLADSDEGRIFVSRSTPWEKDVAIGDVVKVKGVLSILQNNLQIKNVTLVEKVAKGKATVITPVEETISTISSLDPAQRLNTRGNYYKLTVYVLIDEITGDVSLMDDNQHKLTVNRNSNINAFTDYKDKRVQLNVVVHSYNQTQQSWSISYADDSIVEKPHTIETVIELAKGKLAIPSAIRSDFTLPTSLASVPGTVISYQLQENTALTLVEDKLVYSIPETEVKTVLTVVVNFNGESDSYELDLTIPTVQAQTVSEFLADEEVPQHATVIVKGNVLGVTTSYGYYSSSKTTEKVKIILLQDAETKENIIIEFRSDDNTQNGKFEAFNDDIEIGDEIEVTGLCSYESSGFKVINSTTELVIYSQGNEVFYGTDTAVLLDEDTHKDLRNNLFDYYGKVIKIENPYLKLSTSSAPNTSAENWIRIGYDESLTIPSDVEHNKMIAFNNGTTGKTYFNDPEGFTTFIQEKMNIPYSSANGSQFDGHVYAYIVYISSTYIQVAIVDEAHWHINRDLGTQYLFEKSIPTTIEIGTTSINLPTTFTGIDGNITWSSSNNELINPSTGAVSETEKSAPVELTAAYQINGKDYESTIIVTVMGSAYISVDEVLANALNNAVVKVKGIVVGFHWNGSSSNIKAETNGLLVKDASSNQILYVTGLYGVYGEELGEYIVDGQAIKKGDEVQFTGTYTIGTEEESIGRKNVSVAAIMINSSNNDYSFNLDEAIEVSSDADLDELVKALPHGQLLKFTGGFALSGSTKTYGSGINFRVVYDGTTLSEIKHTTPWDWQQIFSFKLNGNELNLGSNWWDSTLRITILEQVFQA